MFRRKKLGMTKKQKATLKRMKKNRQIDSNNLRNLIEQKQKWAVAERVKGLRQIEALKAQVLKLEGIILFIKDLLEPEEKENK